MLGNNYFFNLIVVGLIFLIFFLILTILGYSLFNLLLKKAKKKDENINPTFWEQFFISFAIGLVIFISYAYILDIFEIFNFFTAYLFIIFYDLTIIIYLIIKKKQTRFLADFFKSIRIFFSDNRKWGLLIILLIILVVNFITQWFILTRAMALLYIDPYLWYKESMYIVYNGHIDYDRLPYRYPSGFSFFNAGALLIVPDFIMGYYYHKFISIYLVSLYIIITFLILRRYFDKIYLILIGLIFLLLSKYFLYRMFPYVSSSLATGLILISILVIVNKLPDYFIGFFIIGLYLINPASAFFYIITMVLFLALRFFLYVKEKEVVIGYIKSLIMLIGVVIIVAIPYILCIYFKYNHTLIDLIGAVVRIYNKDYSSSVNVDTLYLIKFVFPLNYIEPYANENKILEQTNQLLKRSIFIFFVFCVISLFLYIKPKGEKEKENFELILFCKICIILIIAVFYIPIFIHLRFIRDFSYRTVEGFFCPIIILALIGIDWIVEKSKKLTVYLASKVDFYKKLIYSKKKYSKILQIENIIIIVLIGSASITFIQHPIPMNWYYYDDDFIEAHLYLRENIEPGSKVLKPHILPTSMYLIFFDCDVESWDLNNNSNYNELLLEIQDFKPDYLIYSKNFFENKSINKVILKESSLENLFENGGYIIFKVD